MQERLVGQNIPASHHNHHVEIRQDNGTLPAESFAKISDIAFVLILIPLRPPFKTIACAQLVVQFKCRAQRIIDPAFRDDRFLIPTTFLQIQISNFREIPRR